MALKREKDRLMHQLKQQVLASDVTTKYLYVLIKNEFTEKTLLIIQRVKTSSQLGFALPLLDKHEPGLGPCLS